MPKQITANLDPVTGKIVLREVAEEVHEITEPQLNGEIQICKAQIATLEQQLTHWKQKLAVLSQALIDATSKNLKL